MNYVSTTGRSVPEWIGKTPDAKVPDHVRLRIFERHNGFCHITKRKIMAWEAWELEHVKPLHAGGEHRERNMAPALVAPHKAKTAQERKVKAKIDRTRKKHIGIKAKSKFAASRDGAFKQKLNGTIERRR